MHNTIWSRQITFNSLNQSIVLSPYQRSRSTPSSFLFRAICASCERDRETRRVCTRCRSLSVAGRLINFMESTKERYFELTARTHRVSVFPTSVSCSYCSTFVPARDRWIAVIQPGDTATGYSLVHMPRPTFIPYPCTLRTATSVCVVPKIACPFTALLNVYIEIFARIKKKQLMRDLISLLCN